MFEHLEFKKWQGVPGSATVLRERWAKEPSTCWVWQGEPVQREGYIVERWYSGNRFAKEDDPRDVRSFIFSVPNPDSEDSLNKFDDYVQSDTDVRRVFSATREGLLRLVLRIVQEKCNVAAKEYGIAKSEVARVSDLLAQEQPNG